MIGEPLWSLLGQWIECGAPTGPSPLSPVAPVEAGRSTQDSRLLPKKSHRLSRRPQSSQSRCSDGKAVFGYKSDWSAGQEATIVFYFVCLGLSDDHNRAPSSNISGGPLHMLDKVFRKHRCTVKDTNLVGYSKPILNFHILSQLGRR